MSLRLQTMSDVPFCVLSLVCPIFKKGSSLPLNLYQIRFKSSFNVRKPTNPKRYCFEILDTLDENTLKAFQSLNQKQKEQFDAEQHLPIEPITTEEKAAPEDLEIDKPFEEAEVKTYTVKVGDTLYSLSNKFYITIEQLKELNNMKDNNLRVGQVLVVSL